MTETKELVNKEISAESDFDVKFEDGKLKLAISYAGKGADAGAFVNVEPEYFIEKLKKAIPGKIDDAVLDMLLVAFKVS